jgi:hypothetical protein
MHLLIAPSRNRARCLLYSVFNARRVRNGPSLFMNAIFEAASDIQVDRTSSSLNSQERNAKLDCTLNAFVSLLGSWLVDNGSTHKQIRVAGEDIWANDGCEASDKLMASRLVDEWILLLFGLQLHRWCAFSTIYGLLTLLNRFAT